MSEERDTRRNEAMQGIRQIIREVDDLHKQLRAFQDRLIALENRAGDAGIPRLKLALRDAYVKSSKAGEGIVQAHVELNNATLSGSGQDRSK